MRVLLVHNMYQQPGGEDVAFRQELGLLEKAGHEVLTYCRSNAEISNCSTLERLALPRQMIWARDTYQEVSALLRWHKPEVAHIHNTFLMVSPSIYAACRDAGVSVIQTLHNYRLFCPAAGFYRSGQLCEDCVAHNLWRSVYHGCYRQSRAETAGVALMLETHRLLRTWATLVDVFVTLTNFAREKFIACGLPSAKTVTKPNFVDPDPGARGEAGDYVLFVGRLSPEKGPETLLQAWSRMRIRVPLRIIGDGPERIRLESSLDGLRGCVSFAGQVNRREVLSALKGSRFLVFPSEWYESFPMVIAEAFACGVPVIAARLGAARELVTDRRTGLHFTPSDPNDLARKVEWAWTHTAEMESMGQAARKEFEAKYTAERNHQMLMQVYQSAHATSRL